MLITRLQTNWIVAANIGAAVVNFGADVWAATVTFGLNLITSVIYMMNMLVNNPFVTLFVLATIITSAFMYHNEHNVMAVVQVAWTCTIKPVMQNLILPIVEVLTYVTEKLLQAWNFYWMLGYKYIGDLLLLPMRCIALPQFMVTTVLSAEPVAKGMYLLGKMSANSLYGVSPDQPTSAATAAFFLRPLSTLCAAASDVAACTCSSGTYVLDVVTLILANRHLECTVSNLLRVPFEVVAILLRTILEALISIAKMLIWLLRSMLGIPAGAFPVPDAAAIFFNGTALLVDDLNSAMCCLSDFVDDVGGSVTYLTADITGTPRDKIEPLLVGGVLRGPIVSVTESLYLLWSFTLDWMLHGYTYASRNLDDSRFYGAQIDACESIAGSFAHASKFISTGVDAGVAFTGRVVAGNFNPVSPGTGAQENETVLTTLGTITETIVNGVTVLPLVLGYESLGKICTATVHSMWGIFRIIRDLPDYNTYKSAGYFDCMVHDLREAADLTAANVDHYAKMIPKPRGCRLNASESLLPYCKDELFDNGSAGRFVGSIPRAAAEVLNYVVAVTEHASSFEEARRVSPDGVYDELNEGMRGLSDMLRQVLHIAGDGGDMFVFNVSYRNGQRNLTVSLPELVAPDHFAGSVETLGVLAIEIVRYVSRIIHRGKFSSWSFDRADLESLARAEYNLTEQLSHFISAPLCALQKANGGNSDRLGEILEINLGGPPGSGFKPLLLVQPCPQKAVDKLLRAAGQILNSVLLLAFHPDQFSEEMFDHAACELESTAVTLREALNGLDNITVDISSKWKTEPMVINLGTAISSAAKGAIKLITLTNRLLTTVVATFTRNATEQSTPQMPYGLYAMDECSDATPISVPISMSHVCSRCDAPAARQYANNIGIHGDICHALVGKRTQCCPSTGQCARSCGQKSTMFTDSNEMVQALVATIDDIAEPFTILNPKARKAVARTGYVFAQLLRMVLRELCNAAGPVSGQRLTNADVLANGACSVDEAAAAAGNIIALPISIIGQIIWVTAKNDANVVKVADGFEKLSAAAYGSIFALGAEAGEVASLALRSLGMLLDGNFKASDWKGNISQIISSVTCWSAELRAGVREVVASLDVSQSGYMCEAGDSVEAVLGVGTAIQEFVLSGLEKAIGTDTTTTSSASLDFSLAVLYKALRRIALAAGNQVSGAGITLMSIFSPSIAANPDFRRVCDGLGGLVGSAFNMAVSVLEAYLDVVGLILPPIRSIGIGGFTTDTYKPLKVIIDAFYRFLCNVASTLDPIAPTVSSIVRAVAKILYAAFLDPNTLMRNILTAFFNFFVAIPNFIVAFVTGTYTTALTDLVNAFVDLTNMMWQIFVRLLTSFLDKVIFANRIFGNRTFTGCMANLLKCVACMTVGGNDVCDTKKDVGTRTYGRYSFGPKTDGLKGSGGGGGGGGGYTQYFRAQNDSTSSGHIDSTSEMTLSGVLHDALLYVPVTDPCFKTITIFRSLVIGTICDIDAFDWTNLDDERDPTYSQSFITRMRMRYEIAICTEVASTYKRAATDGTRNTSEAVSISSSSPPPPPSPRTHFLVEQNPDIADDSVVGGDGGMPNATNLTAWLQTSLLGKDCLTMSDHPLCKYAFAVQEINVVAASAAATVKSILFGIDAGMASLRQDLQAMGVDPGVAVMFERHLRHDAHDLDEALGSFFTAVTDMAGVELSMEDIVDLYAEVVGIVKEAYRETEAIVNRTARTTAPPSSLHFVDENVPRSFTAKWHKAMTTMEKSTQMRSNDGGDINHIRSGRKRQSYMSDIDGLPLWWYSSVGADGGDNDIVYRQPGGGGGGDGSLASVTARYPGASTPNAKWCGHDVTWANGLAYSDPRIDDQAGNYLAPDMPSTRTLGCSEWCTENCSQPAYTITVEGFCQAFQGCRNLSPQRQFIATAFCSRVCGTPTPSTTFRNICIPYSNSVTRRDHWVLNLGLMNSEWFTNRFPRVDITQLMHFMDINREYTSDYRYIGRSKADELCQVVGDTGLTDKTPMPYRTFCQRKCDMTVPDSYVRLAMLNMTESVQFKRLLMDLCNDFCFPYDASCRRMRPSINCMESAHSQAACMSTCDVTWDMRNPGPRKGYCFVEPNMTCDTQEDRLIMPGTDKACRCPLDGSGTLNDYRTCNCNYNYGSNDMSKYSYGALPFFCPSTLKNMYKFFADRGSDGNYTIIDYRLLTESIAFRHNVTIDELMAMLNISTILENTSHYVNGSNSSSSDVDNAHLIAERLFSLSSAVMLTISVLNMDTTRTLVNRSLCNITSGYRRVSLQENITEPYPLYLKWIDAHELSGSVTAVVERIDRNYSNWQCDNGFWTLEALIEATAEHITTEYVDGEQVPSCVFDIIWKSPLSSSMLCKENKNGLSLPLALLRKCRTSGGFCSDIATYDNPQPTETCIPELHCTSDAMYLDMCNTTLSDGYIYATMPTIETTTYVSRYCTNIQVEPVVRRAVWVVNRTMDQTSCILGAFYYILERPATLMLWTDTITQADATYKECTAIPDIPQTYAEFQQQYEFNTSDVIYTFGKEQPTVLQYSDGLDFCGELCGIHDPACLELLHETPRGLNCTKYRTQYPSDIAAFGSYGAKRWLCNKFPSVEYLSADLFPLYGPGTNSAQFNQAGFTYMSDLQDAVSCPKSDGSWGNNFDLYIFGDNSHQACAMMPPVAVPGQSPTSQQCVDVNAMLTRLTMRYEYARRFYKDYVNEFFQPRTADIRNGIDARNDVGGDLVLNRDMMQNNEDGNIHMSTSELSLSSTYTRNKMLGSLASVLRGLKVPTTTTATTTTTTTTTTTHTTRIASDQTYVMYTPCLSMDCQLYRDTSEECKRYPEPQTRPSDRLPPRICSLSFIRPCTRVVDLMEVPDDPNDIFGKVVIIGKGSGDSKSGHPSANIHQYGDDGYIATPVDNFILAAKELITTIRSLRTDMYSSTNTTTTTTRGMKSRDTIHIPWPLVQSAWNSLKLRLELAACAAVPGSSPCNRMDEAASHNKKVREARVLQEQNLAVEAHRKMRRARNGNGIAQPEISYEHVAMAAEHQILRESIEMLHTHATTTTTTTTTSTATKSGAHSTEISIPRTMRDAFDKRWISVLPDIGDILDSCYILCGYNYSDLLERACLRDLFPSPDNLIWVIRDLSVESLHLACDAVYETDGSENFDDGLGINANWFNMSKLRVRDPVRRSNGTTGEVQSLGPSAGILQFVFTIGNSFVNILVKLFGIGKYVNPAFGGGVNGDGDVFGNPEYLNGNYAAHYITAYSFGLAGTTSSQVLKSELMTWILNINTEPLYGPTGLIYWLSTFTPFAITCGKLRGDVKIFGIPIYTTMMLPMLPTWGPGKALSLTRSITGIERVVPPKMVYQEEGDEKTSQCFAAQAPPPETSSSSSSSSSSTDTTVSTSCSCKVEYYSCGEAYGFWDPLDSVYFVFHALLPSVAKWKIFAWMLGPKYAVFARVNEAVDLHDYWWCFALTFWGNFWGFFVLGAVITLVIFGVSFVIAIVKLTVMLAAWLIVYAVSGYQPTRQYRYTRPGASPPLPNTLDNDIDDAEFEGDGDMTDTDRQQPVPLQRRGGGTAAAAATIEDTAALVAAQRPGMVTNDIHYTQHGQEHRHHHIQRNQPRHSRNMFQRAIALVWPWFYANDELHME
jgi:hypothetical protein